MAEHELISTQLNILAVRLPAPAVDELADGLYEAYETQLAEHRDPDAAAHLALAQFGDADTVTAAFIRHSPWRRTALALLATGPLIGALWATTLITSQAWDWPISTPVRVIYGATLLTIVLTLALSSRARTAYNRTRWATATGAIGLVILDALMLTAIAILEPALSWPLTLAVAASLIRAMTTLRMIPALLAR
jgi:hypothetical protein